MLTGCPRTANAGAVDLAILAVRRAVLTLGNRQGEGACEHEAQKAEGKLHFRRWSGVGWLGGMLCCNG